MAQIEWDQVSKWFGPVAAVRDIRLTARDREFLVLLGPSGCGKTTTLRMAAGLEAPTAGRVLLGARDVTHVEPRDRDLAMVFQNYALYPHMTVYDNLAFGLKLRKTPPANIRRAVQDTAVRLGLESLLHRRPSELSGGQRQRVALGRAMVREPQAFLMDEPLSNLDATLRAETRVQLKALHAQLATTVVYVTHDQTEAMTLATRIVVMSGGVIQQVDTPEAIYDHPANQFVATFIGTPGMNMLPVLWTRADGQLAAVIGAQRLPLPPGLPWMRAAASSGHHGATLGVRPEHLRMSGAPDPATPSLKARIRLVEPMGHETLVHLDLDPDLTLVARTPDRWPNGNIPIWVSFDPRRLHVFDSVSQVAYEAV